MAEMKEEKAMDETVQEDVETSQPEDTEPVKETETGENAETEEAEAEQEPSGEAETEETSQKKGFFAKRKDKKDKKDIQIEELTDRVRRQMAEFDNFRKRTEKEKVAMYEVGARSVIEKFLPVVDNFERGLAGVEENCEDPFTEGMQKIYKQLMTTLESLEVRPIEAVGQEFNPDFHNAVMHVEEEETAENTITEEFLKGYTYKDQVVRHSMVKVAN